MAYAAFRSIGAYVPQKILTNADLSQMVDTTDEWITKRTGIKERHIAAKNETTSDMGVEAAKKAIERSGINKSDIDLAVTTKSILIGFNIKANHQIIKLSKTNNIKINIFNVIYDVLDHINELVQKLLLQDQKETVIGTAEVKKIFNQDLKIVIAGCVIVQGKIKQNAIIKIFRKNNLVYKGSIQSIKVFKNTVHEVSTGTECGISIKDYNNIQINDKIKAYSNSQD